MKRFVFPKDATPIDDISGLKLSWILSLKDLNRAEVANIMKAQQKYLKPCQHVLSEWFNPRFLRDIHYAMFNEVWDWAGAWRRSITNIGVKPQYIPMKMSEFCAKVIVWETDPCEMNIFERSARIHHQLVVIHPFENGNGRFSRLVSDRYLLAHSSGYPIWPSQLAADSAIRQKYISSLKEADRGDFQPLVMLMREFTN